MNFNLNETSAHNEYHLTEYMEQIHDKICLKLPQVKKSEKISNVDICVPKIDESELLLRYNYSIPQLKMFAKEYKLKTAGNKTQLIRRLYTHLFLSNLIIKIQKRMRGVFHRKYLLCRGPALKTRSLCTNSMDFLSMENVTEIPLSQFFSYKDDDGFVYGFDVLSFYNLIHKTNGIIKNPYNMQPIASHIINTFKSVMRLSNILNVSISIVLDDVTKNMSIKKTIELRTLGIFQNIDALGNYSNPQWLISLNKIQLIRFIRELIDIWCYRAPLIGNTKREICPPIGNPFSKTNYNFLHNTENLDIIRNHVLELMDKFVNSGVNKDSKCLGAYYVLGALTLVNHDAATSMPWLYQAFAYM
jgi:hypothetical protein